MSRATWLALGLIAAMGETGTARAETPAERGKQALLTRAFTPASFTLEAYDKVWKQWGLKEKPAEADHDRLFRERYGLPTAPYANGRLPMGLREGAYPLSLTGRKGVAIDCMVCHGGSIAGKSYVGLGNTSLDLQAFFDEMAAADGIKGKAPIRFSNVRGTNEAGATSVWLMGLRNPDLTVKLNWTDLGLHDDLCEDVPAWWLLKKKKTMYYTGGANARSVRSIMQFMMTPLNGPAVFAKEEKTFADILAYLLTIEPPKYPLPIDDKLASAGEKVFAATCATCHGTYGDKPTYPNKIVPLDRIGTDRSRFYGVGEKYGEVYNASWFAKEKDGWFNEGYKAIDTDGYQAPPLDGVWATAPYLHNGSVPTVYHLLNSKTRPKVFTRSYATDLEAYDAKHLGWKFKELDTAPDAKGTAPIEFRKVYDTSKSGRGNAGHTFGDSLSEAERMAVIEYLKTL